MFVFPLLLQLKKAEVTFELEAILEDLFSRGWVSQTWTDDLFVLDLLVNVCLCLLQVAYWDRILIQPRFV